MTEERRVIRLEMHPTVTDTHCGKCPYQFTGLSTFEEDHNDCIRHEFMHPYTGKPQSLWNGRLDVCRDSEINPDMVDC